LPLAASRFRNISVPRMPSLLLGQMKYPMRLVFALLLMGICAGTATAAEVVAKAGAIQLDVAQVRALVAALPEQNRAVLAKDLGALEQVVRADLANRIVLAEAEAAGFERKPETIAELARIRGDALARLWILSHATVPAQYPSDADVSAAFDQVKASLHTPAEYRLSQIFVSAPDGLDAAKTGLALKKAADIAARLAGKADFGKLARELSEQAESATRDGDLGWLPEDRLLPEVVRAVKTLKPGEVAGPVKTAQGFHFLRLTETRPERQLTLEESRQTLVAALRARRAQELQQKYLADLATKQSVSVNQIALSTLQAQLK
jgi:hypothetical protein